MHVNKINCKRYIGITSKRPQDRWLKGKGYFHCSYFYNAICKYGWDGFYHFVLKMNLTKSEAEAEEIKLIKEYNSQDRRYGYNLDAGGYAGKHSQETLDKISKANKGHNVSEEARELYKQLYSKPILCVELNEVYRSAGEAAKEFPITRITIQAALSGRLKTAGGYHWKYVN